MVRSRATTGTMLARKRAARRREHGAVMILIMIIIIITTAAAAVSIDNTSADARASGRELMTIQARYSAEAALVTSLAWFDINRNELPNTWENNWKLLPQPDMRKNSAGHLLTNTNFGSVRLMPSNLSGSTMLVQPVSAADITAPIPDPTGSFGPNQVYQAAPYELDLNDCFVAPPTEGNVTDHSYSRYCVLTVRNRLVLTGGSVPMTWKDIGPVVLPPGLLQQDVLQDRSGAAHDSRATIITPAVYVHESGVGDGS